MPTFKMLDPSSFVFRWDDLGSYQTVVDRADRIVLRYDPGRSGEPLDEDRSPARIQLDIVNGEVRSVLYRKLDGDVLARITGLDTDAELVRYLLETDRGWAVYQTLLQGGATFRGARTTDDGNNDLTTSLWDDVANVSGGDAYIKDRGGADRYVAKGDGYQQVSYDEWFWRAPEQAEQGVLANLKAGRITGPDGETDRLVGQWEGVRGSFLDDRLLGSGRDEEFEGMHGADVINGRGGFDLVSYRNDDNQGGERGVLVNFAKGFARDGFGDRDTLRNIEGAEGTDRRDVFIDNGGDDYLRGREGNDLFRVAGGNDYLRGDEGADRFIFKGRSFGDDQIEGFDGAEGDRIKIAAANGPGALDISRDGGDIVIRLNDDSAVRLLDHDGGVADYLVF